MAYTVFIDGEAGTTGLRIYQHLSTRKDLRLVKIPEEHRKSLSYREDALNQADVAILCLPENASREAVNLAENHGTRLIDTSIAHRIDPNWVYGFPEFAPSQSEKIMAATYVTNPGCYACGAIAILNPLVKSEIIAVDYPLTINAVSGYSGGGKKLIAEFEGEKVGEKNKAAFYQYSLDLEHKHTEEIRVRSGLEKRPLFVPSVGRYFQGMIVSVPIHLWALGINVGVRSIHKALSEFYADYRFVSVPELEECSRVKNYLDPRVLNETNEMLIYVFGNDERQEIQISAVFDNLGKGASGQAVQCLNLMLGLREDIGL